MHGEDHSEVKVEHKEAERGINGGQQFRRRVDGMWWRRKWAETAARAAETATEKKTRRRRSRGNLGKKRRTSVPRGGIRRFCGSASGLLRYNGSGRHPGRRVFRQCNYLVFHIQRLRPLFAAPTRPRLGLFFLHCGTSPPNSATNRRRRHRRRRNGRIRHPSTDISVLKSAGI